MLELVGCGKRVLCVGDASGDLARILSQRHCLVTRIDYNITSQEIAQYCHRTIAADLDNEEISTLFCGETFDSIIFDEVIPRFRDPWRVMDGARSILQDHGFVVASIPNAAHGALRLARMCPDFGYPDDGPLGAPVPRLFTRRTVDELFVRSGFAIERIERTTLPLFQQSDLVPPIDERSFDAALVARVRKDPEVETLAFVVKGNALSDHAKLTQLTQSYVAVNAELAAADDQGLMQEQELGRANSRLEFQLELLDQKSAEIAALRDQPMERNRERSTFFGAQRMMTALRVASEQVDALNDQRIAVERCCAHLAAEREEYKARAIAAERNAHHHFVEFADDFGSVANLAISRETIPKLRSSHQLILAQLEHAEKSLREAIERASEVQLRPLVRFERLINAVCRRATRR